jgi:hypothetical protein
MADESKEPKYLVVYSADHDGEPLALIRTDLPGNHATEAVRALKMLGSPVHVAATNSTALSRNEDVADLFAAGPASPTTGGAAPDPDEPGSNADPDAVLRAEIRTQLELDERRKRVEAEVKREMAEDRKAEAKA